MTAAAVPAPAPATHALVLREGWLLLRVAAIARVGEVCSLGLVSPTGETLPSFTPGSHVVVEAGGRSNAYSLTGAFLDPDAYEISVLRIAGGQGGSRWIHELKIGDGLAVSPPRSGFAPVPKARHHVLVAAGIGITPILSHARAAHLYGRSFEVVYGYARGPGAKAPHLEELRGLCGPDRVRIARGREQLLAMLRERLADQPLGAVLFICGPGPMMEDAQALAAGLGWPPQRIHCERFSIPALDPGTPFSVRLRRSGRRVRVESGVSLLEALEAAAVPVANLCRQGVCGECRVTVTEGRPEHRDLFLSDEERAAGDSVMCCVSRARDELLELDL